MRWVGFKNETRRGEVAAVASMLTLFKLSTGDRERERERFIERKRIRTRLFARYPIPAYPLYIYIYIYVHKEQAQVEHFRKESKPVFRVP